MITLENIKARELNEGLYKRLCRTRELSDDWNRRVYRHRMDSGEQRSIDTLVWDMTHSGNSPLDNEVMLDKARCYIQENVFTDEEWEKYFTPAINKMIEYNNSFVRWHTGYIIREKKTGKLAIVEYDYAAAFGGRDFTSLSICELDSEGKINYSWAWAQYQNYELVDKEHIQENIAKLKEYHKKYSEVPYFMSPEMENLLYH